MFVAIWLSVFTLQASSTPVDYPIKVDLPVYNDPQTNYQPSSDVYLAAPLLPENHPGVDTLHNNIGPNPGHKTEPADSLIDYKTRLGYETKPQAAILETEGLGSTILSKKENVQHLAAGFLQPKPIVDTIREDEKYGNNGDKFYTAGRAVVGSAENISNFINSIIGVPGTILNKITRGLTEKLNQIGGNIVGL